MFLTRYYRCCVSNVWLFALNRRNKYTLNIYRERRDRLALKWAMELTKWNHRLPVNFNFYYSSRFSLYVVFRMALSTTHIIGLTAPSSLILNYVRLLAGEGSNRHANIDTKLRMLSQNMEQTCMWLVSTVAGESLSKRSVCACPAFLHVSSSVSCVTPFTNLVLLGRLKR